MSRAIATAVAVALLTVAVPARAAAACDERELALLDDLLSSSRGDGASYVAAALSRACPMTPALAKSHRMVAVAGLDTMASAGLHVVADDPALWQRACVAGPGAILELGRHLDDPQFGPRQRAAVLWSRCGVERLGVATADEWSRAGKGAELALATAVWLRDEAKLSPARVRSYARALAGVDRPAPKSLGERYPDDGLAPPPPPPPPRRMDLRATPKRKRSPPAPPPARIEDPDGGGVAGGIAGGLGGGGFGRPLTVTLSFFVGRQSDAQRDEHTVAVAAADLARCWELPAPPRTTLRLVIADGVASDGELLDVRLVDGVKHVDRARVGEAFARCLLARVGRLRFEAIAQPTTIELDLVRR